MFHDADSWTFQRAKMLRAGQTLTEIKLWEHLKGGKLGCKFRRQHPFNEYILDFYCHSKKIVIEIDGKNHNEKIQKHKDKYRDDYLNSKGIKVMRFTNDEVIENIDSVLDIIKKLLI